MLRDYYFFVIKPFSFIVLILLLVLLEVHFLSSEILGKFNLKM